MFIFGYCSLDLVLLKVIQKQYIEIIDIPQKIYYYLNVTIHLNGKMYRCFLFH